MYCRQVEAARSAFRAELAALFPGADLSARSLPSAHVDLLLVYTLKQVAPAPRANYIHFVLSNNYCKLTIDVTDPVPAKPAGGVADRAGAEDQPRH